MPSQWRHYAASLLAPSGRKSTLGVKVATIRKGVRHEEFVRGTYRMLTLLLWCAGPASADFNWGNSGGTCAGSGTFQQQIPYINIIDVGEIPAGKEGVYIRLTSAEDVDIQLYDKQTGEKIVGWPDGILSGPSIQTTQYHGVTVEWSGYNGDGVNYGHEYIRLTGTTDRPLLMRAFGYRAGYATVDYSWTGTAGCTPGGGPAPSGSGTFKQPISHNSIAEVGELIPGLKDVYIELVSDNDIDVQLYDKLTGEKIVGWPDGILSGPSIQTTQYHGVTVEWSGYNGDGVNYGHEYIRLTGALNRPFIMKVFGFQSGYATVNYHWGGSGALNGANLAFPLSGYTPYTVPIIAVVDHAMTTGGGCADGIVVAYTGEKGLPQYGTSYWNSPSENPSVCPSNILYGFKNSTGTAFSINGQYNSPDPYGNNLFLFYDGHTGYDYPVKNGTEVHAAADGTATYDYSSPVGFGVKIASTSGYDTYYLHLSARSISNGQSVSKGMNIGQTGSGHLHFTVKKGAQRADPYGWRGEPGTDPLKVDGKDNVCLWETCQ